MVLVDLVTPWAADPDHFPRRENELLESIRRQRAPTEQFLPASTELPTHAARAGGRALQQLIKEATRELASIGFPAVGTIALVASSTPGPVAEALPARQEGRVALFVDRGDDDELVRGLASAVALLTRWRHPVSPVATMVAGGNWDRWKAVRSVPLVEWYYGEGLAVHAARAVAPGVSDSQLLGVGRNAFNRLRKDEEELVRLLERDLEKSGPAVVIKWLQDHSPPSLRSSADGFVVPAGAGRYLAWRDLRTRVARVGVVAACGMSTG